MKTILNVIWLVLSGFWLFLGLPGRGLAALHHHHRHPVRHRGVPHRRLRPVALRVHDGRAPRRRCASCIGNVLWLVLAGWWLALGHIVTGLALCLTIIGIPFGIANFKLIPVSLLPLGREIVPTDQPFAAR